VHLQIYLDLDPQVFEFSNLILRSVQVLQASRLGSVGTSTCDKYSQVFKHYVSFYIIFSVVIVLNVLYYHINNKTTQMIAQIKYIQCS